MVLWRPFQVFGCLDRMDLVLKDLPCCLHTYTALAAETPGPLHIF